MNPTAPGGSKRRVTLASSPSLPWQASLPQGRALFVPLVPFVGLPAPTTLRARPTMLPLHPPLKSNLQGSGHPKETAR